MLYEPWLAPTPERLLADVAEATRLVHAVRDRLDEIAASAGAIAAETDWRAPSAVEFHERIDQWHRMLLGAQTRADHTVDAFARARASVQARAWAAQP